MALDGKTIKEEIPDKEIFENNIRRTKGKEKRLKNNTIHIYLIIIHNTKL